jgi:biotin transport system substrate-specific component
MQRLTNVPVFPAALVAAIAGGILIVYGCGIAGLMIVAHMGALQAMLATAVFLPGDLVKALAAAFVAKAAEQAYPAALGHRT